MAAGATNPKVDAFFCDAQSWRDEFSKLRPILLACGLTETLKWGVPCYTNENKNIVLMHGFKDYCAILFFKGALLKDDDGILVRQSDNVQAARQVRFTSVDEIVRLEPVLKSYVRAAIEVERAGRTVALKSTAEFDVAEEFQVRLDQDAALKAAFGALTPGRQKAYLLHFSAAKQSSTRRARVEKCAPKILDGKGLDD